MNGVTVQSSTQVVFGCAVVGFLPLGRVTILVLFPHLFTSQETQQSPLARALVSCPALIVKVQKFHVKAKGQGQRAVT